MIALVMFNLLDVEDGQFAITNKIANFFENARATEKLRQSKTLTKPVNSYLL